MTKISTNLNNGWRQERDQPSLSEVYRSVPVPKTGSWFRKFLAFAGPGYLVAVGYMDPGNWATDLEGGSLFNYRLLSIIFISNIMAMVLQALAGKLGIVTGRDLAQACRDHYSKPVSFCLWILCEIAIAACDLAELIGSAIALELLFGIPLLWGIMITALDIMIVLFLQSKGFRYLESVVLALISVVGICFAIEMFLVKPDILGIAGGFIPTKDIVMNTEMLYIAIGIIGATVMPHNLYLQSSIIQTRRFEETYEGKKQAIKYSTWSTNLALCFALVINAAILIMSAAAFYGTGKVDDISAAYELFTPMLGTTLASTLFAVALLASGQNSTLTGTLAGQIVMEGFLNIKLKPWLRRLITRSVAIVPAIIVAALYGKEGTGKLLILSQVILSFQLPFAVFPLVQFTSDKAKMGPFVNSTFMKIICWSIALIIAGLDIYLLIAE